MVRVSSKAVVVLLALALLLVIAAPAFGLTNSSTTKQISPGVMRRVIWGQTQVFQYPIQVTHTGNIHVELKFNPDYNSNFLNVFLWDDNNSCFENIDQGWRTISSGKCVVDYWVPSISEAGEELVSGDPLTTDDDHLLGDTYTVVVVVYNDWDSRFSIWGYSSQTDVNAGEGTDTTSEDNCYLQPFRYPTTGTKRLVGVPYGSPWDFKVMSEGAITCGLEFPADAKNKVVTYDPVNASGPGVWEQYLYAGGNWDTVISDYLTSAPSFWPTMWGIGEDAWYGLYDDIDVSSDTGFAKPGIVYHYYPDLVLQAGDYAKGPFAPLASGITTMGYKATLTYPCNMNITKAPSSAVTGAKVTLRGTFALNGDWVPAGTLIQVLFKAQGASSWVTKAQSIKVGESGAWTARVTINKTGYWRAAGVGDENTGLQYERSASKMIKAR